MSATKQANSTKSASALKSRMNEIERENKKKTEAEKKITEYDKKIANKEKELLREEQRLSKAKDDEYKQIERQRKMVMDNLSLDLSIQKENQNRLISEVNKLKDAKEKINILFIASNPDIEFVDDDGNTKQKQKLKLEKEAREIHESIQKSLKRDSNWLDILFGSILLFKMLFCFAITSNGSIPFFFAQSKHKPFKDSFPSLSVEFMNMIAVFFLHSEQIIN